MLKFFKQTGLNAICGAAAFSAAMSLAAGAALAGDSVSSDQILKALTPKPRLTRSLSGAPAADTAATAAENQFISTVRNRRTRSLSFQEREQIATIAKDKPNIDLEIQFDYNSAKISPAAMPQVEALGKALASAELKGATFVVAGFTDGTGGEAYNQDLSERRADAIKQYLTEHYGVAGADLVTVGYGKTKLKNPNNPADPANRRVQVVTMANKTASQ